MTSPVITEAAVPAPSGAAPAALSRRSFLGLAALVGTSAAIPVAVGRAVDRSPQPLVASQFLAHVGSEFSFDPGEGPVPLRLVDVAGVGRQARAEHAFTLVFDGPAAREQGGHVGELAGPGLEPLALLVVPSGLAAAGRQEWSATIVGGPQ